MVSKTKLLQDASGNYSSTRLIGISIIYAAILFVLICIIFAFKNPDQASSIIVSATGLFTAMTSTTFYYLYSNKKVETNKELELNNNTNV